MRLAVGSRRLVVITPVVAVLLLAIVVLSSLGVQHWGLLGLAGSHPPLASATSTATATATATLAPTPLPTATPDPNIARNTAMGCVDGPPASSPHVIYGMKDYQTGGAAPREVALTFDDGPTPYTSPPILDYLEQSHTPATFFVMGLYAHVWPDLIQREWRDGFAIGIHSWDHPPMTTVSDGQMAHQFGDSLAAVHAAIGQNACIWFWRPPYGAVNARVTGYAQQYGLTTIQWDADPADWSRPGADVIASRVLAQAHPGSIILMHDGPANRQETLAALPRIVAGLRERGLTPVTIPQLLADSHYPGVSTVPHRPPTHQLDTAIGS